MNARWNCDHEGFCATLAAFAPTLPLRATLAGIRDTRTRVIFVEDPESLVDVVQREAIDLVLVDLSPPTDGQVARALAAVHVRAVSLPLIGWCRVTRGTSQSVVHATRLGVTHLIFHAYDDVVEVIHRAWTMRQELRAIEYVLKVTQPELPRAVGPFVRVVLQAPAAAATVASLATLANIDRRTLERRCASEGLPAPAELVDWIRLLKAAALCVLNTASTQDPLAIVGLAQFAGFASPRSMIRVARRYLCSQSSGLTLCEMLHRAPPCFRARLRATSHSGPPNEVRRLVRHARTTGGANQKSRMGGLKE